MSTHNSIATNHYLAKFGKNPKKKDSHKYVNYSTEQQSEDTAADRTMKSPNRERKFPQMRRPHRSCSYSRSLAELSWGELSVYWAESRISKIKEAGGRIGPGGLPVGEEQAEAEAPEAEEHGPPPGHAPIPSFPPVHGRRRRRRGGSPPPPTLTTSHSSSAWSRRRSRKGSPFSARYIAAGGLRAHARSSAPLWLPTSPSPTTGHVGGVRRSVGRSAGQCPLAHAIGQRVAVNSKRGAVRPSVGSAKKTTRGGGG